MLLLVETELQGCWLPSSPPAVVCGWAGLAVTMVWSLEDSMVEVMIPGRKEITEILYYYYYYYYCKFSSKNQYAKNKQTNQQHRCSRTRDIVFYIPYILP